MKVVPIKEVPIKEVPTKVVLIKEVLIKEVPIKAVPIREDQTKEDPNEGGSNQGGSNQGGSNQGGSNQGGSNQGGSNQGESNGNGSNYGGSNQGGSNQGGSNGESSNQGGSNQGGSNQGGSNEGGSNQGGSNQGGSNQGGSNQGGSNQGGSNQGESNENGSNYGGSNQGGSNQGGSNQESSNQGGSNVGGSNQGGSNQNGSGTSPPTKPVPCNNQTKTNETFPGEIVNNKCTKAGFVGDEKNCAKFYRCVDDGKGGLMKFEYTCGTGTVWDQNIFACNYPSAVNGKCGQSGAGDGQSSSTSSPINGQSTGSCSQDGFIGDSKNCSKFYRCVANSQGGFIKYEFSCGKDTVWDQQSLTCNYPWAVDGKCGNQSPSEPAISTTNGSPVSGESTQSPATTISSTLQGGESTTSPTTSGTTQAAIIESTTEGGTHMEPCPVGQLEGDQIALVCPTGFRRHPKYCNLFYQCTSNKNHEYKVLVLNCPQGTIYDDKKIQCLPQNETSQTCTGQIAQPSLYRKLDINAIAPVQMPTQKALCPYEGSHEMEGSECSQKFVKCKRSFRKMEGFLYRCPDGFAYWQISKQCERTSKLLHCDGYSLPRSKWEIPVESVDVSFRRRKDLAHLP